MSSEPLTILILGAGIAGLTAALALRRQGHAVTIYEKSHFAHEVGAAITVPTNVYPLLCRIGMDASQHRAITEQFFTSHTPSGEVCGESDLAVPGKSFTRMIHRVDLHEGLRKKVEEAGVRIWLGCAVKGVDVESGEVELVDGERVRGDLVLGADGVHSLVRESVRPGHESLRPFGCSVFRMLLEREKLEGDERVRARFMRREGEITDWTGDQKMVITYPCRDYQLFNVAGLFNETITAPVDPEEDLKKRMLDLFDDFSEDIKALMRLPEHVMVSNAELMRLQKLLREADVNMQIWRLWDMPTLPTWVNGRTGLIGDAAHPILPFSAQGGAQAIEDGISLGVLFPLGTKPEDVPDRLKLFHEIRHGRVEHVQNFGRSMGRVPHGEKVKAKQTHREFFMECFDHDAWEHAEKMLEAYSDKASIHKL
ncbi:MAG: hypothetical protein MMC23_007665 [Stictis urceolatum]|nr:hypothetical protein [Stictis urceolata]